MSDEHEIKLAKLEAQHEALREDIGDVKSTISGVENRLTGRLAQQDANIRWVVIAVLSSVIAAVMRIITTGGGP